VFSAAEHGKMTATDGSETIRKQDEVVWMERGEPQDA
jgi:hypothetical protein